MNYIWIDNFDAMYALLLRIDPKFHSRLVERYEENDEDSFRYTHKLQFLF